MFNLGLLENKVYPVYVLAYHHLPIEGNYYQFSVAYLSKVSPCYSHSQNNSNPNACLFYSGWWFEPL